jgi:L-ectoine synthase
MKVIRTKSLIGTKRDIQGKGFSSLRILLERDRMGFSLHKTIIPKGDKEHWHYKHHLEACYCISGMGVLTNLETNEEFNITPDTTYVLDNHDDHTFQALDDVVLLSIFNPPVVGNEIHMDDGSYIPANEESEITNNHWE